MSLTEVLPLLPVTTTERRVRRERQAEASMVSPERASGVERIPNPDGSPEGASASQSAATAPFDAASAMNEFPSKFSPLSAT